jgi:sarcosine/dimethylglycine N-methyltransferase
MNRSYSQAARQTQDYYNSADADRFYSTMWRGTEDLHIGIFENPDDSIERANRRTVERMAELAADLGPDTPVIDLGAGYGGTARYLAHTYGSPTTCLNISERQNEINRRINRERGLAHFITVLDGSYEEIPAADESFAIAWSQDAILHSSNRRQVLAEAYRVLQPGGLFIFTDPMQTNDCPPEKLQPIYERVNLDSLGSVEFYQDTARELGFRDTRFVDYSAHLAPTYRRVHDDLEAQYQALVADNVSAEYLDRMLIGLRHWIEGGEQGYLRWGIMLLHK